MTFIFFQMKMKTLPTLHDLCGALVSCIMMRWCYISTSVSTVSLSHMCLSKLQTFPLSLSFSLLFFLLLFLFFFLNYTSSVLLSLISVTVRRNLHAWERNEDTYFCFFPIFVAFCNVTSYLCWKGPLWWLCHTVSAKMDSKLNEFQCWCRRHSFTCVSDRNGQGRTF